MAERRRLREVLLSVFMIAVYVGLVAYAADCSLDRNDAGVHEMDGE